jgi:hypothetical protein
MDAKRLLVTAGATLAMLAGLAGCGASSAPPGPVELRDLLNSELTRLATGLERQDALLAAEPIDDDFGMQNNVAARYSDANWSGSGPSGFLAFLNNVFNLHANIQVSLEMSDLQQTGDLATATVHVVWNSTRTDAVPPGHYTADNVDYFFFRRRAAGWRLLHWQETPAPVPPLTP